MATNGLEKRNQIKLDSNDEKVYHARRTQGCGGFKPYYIDNIIYAEEVKKKYLGKLVTTVMPHSSVI